MVRARNDGEQLNAVALLGTDFSLLQHFSTFSPRMYCSVAYWLSHGGGAVIRKQATFLEVGKPQSRRNLRGEFCKVAGFSQSICTQSSKDGR